MSAANTVRLAPEPQLTVHLAMLIPIIVYFQVRLVLVYRAMLVLQGVWLVYLVGNLLMGVWIVLIRRIVLLVILDII